MSVVFPVTVVELSLSADHLAIKQAIATAANHRRCAVDPLEFWEFQPKLDSDWGRLHHGLLHFIDDVLGGRWAARASQGAPPSLVGDFGEFFLVKQYCEDDPRAEVARVIRPRGYKRPDFIVWEPKHNRLTALECKATVLNAASLEAQARRGGKANLNICLTSRERREKGKAQVGAQVVIKQRSPVPRKQTGHIANYLESRVIANRSVIGTLVVPDGRLARGGSLDSLVVSSPQDCKKRKERKNCRECVAGVGKLHVAFFHNSDVSISPLPPPDSRRDKQQTFAALVSIEHAIWTRSPRRFLAGVRQLARMIDRLTREHGDGRYLSVLLDMIAAGFEVDIADPEACNEILADFEQEAVHAACRSHLLEDTDEGPRPRELGESREGVRLLEDPAAREPDSEFMRALARVDAEFAIWAEHFGHALPAGVDPPAWHVDEWAHNAAIQGIPTGHVRIMVGENRDMLALEGYVFGGRNSVRINFAVDRMEDAEMLFRVVVPESTLHRSGEQRGLVAISNDPFAPDAVQGVVHRSGLGYVQLATAPSPPASAPEPNARAAGQ